MSFIKAIPFTCLILLAACPAGAECLLPGDIVNFVVVAEGDLELSFGTTGTVFGPTDTVRFELMVTNTGASTIQIDFPVHYPESVFVSDVSCPDVETCMSDLEFSYPPVFFYVPGTINLDPGQCERWTIEWDQASDPAPAGSYRAWGGLFAWTDGVERLPLGEWILPADGATISFDIIDTIPAEGCSWGGAKALYR